jgi:hypothetical protein
LRVFQGATQVPGTIIPIISKREYDFSNGNANVTVVKVLDCSAWTEGIVAVRVHGKDIGSGNIKVVAYTSAPTSEDPAEDFISSSASATATIDSSGTVPQLVTSTLSAGFGGFLRIVVEGDAGSGNTRATLSADLVLKS